MEAQQVALDQTLEARIYELKTSSLEEYARNFRPIEGQVGAVFLINGEVVGLDSFVKPETFSKVFKKLLESYALDAIDLQRVRPQRPSREGNGKVGSWMAEVKKAPLVKNPSLGLGDDLRLEGEKIIGSGLLLQKTVFLSVFPKGRADEMGESGPRISRASRRGSFAF